MNRAPSVEAVDRRIEEAGLNALQTQAQLFYDGWLIRVSAGTAKRARSVSAHWESTLPLDDKIAYCERVYQRHELPVLFRMTPFSRPAGLARSLQDRGYVAFDSTLVQSIVLERPPRAHDRPDDAMLRTVDAVTFATAACVLRDSSPEQRNALLERLQHSPLVLRQVVSEHAGEIVACAQMSIEDDLAGVFDVVTRPDVRGRGHASALVGALLAWAWDHAVRRVYLQVRADNAPALAIYRKFGFETRYAYHYFGRPEQKAAW